MQTFSFIWIITTAYGIKAIFAVEKKEEDSF